MLGEYFREYSLSYQQEYSNGHSCGRLRSAVLMQSLHVLS